MIYDASFGACKSTIFFVMLSFNQIKHKKWLTCSLLIPFFPSFNYCNDMHRSPSKLKGNLPASICSQLVHNLSHRSCVLTVPHNQCIASILQAVCFDCSHNQRYGSCTSTMITTVERLIILVLEPVTSLHICWLWCRHQCVHI